MLQCGFDTLNQLIPSLSQNVNAKISKATTLHKGWSMVIVTGNGMRHSWLLVIESGYYMDG